MVTVMYQYHRTGKEMYRIHKYSVAKPELPEPYQFAAIRTGTGTVIFL
jgi:hypothetical protein